MRAGRRVPSLSRPQRGPLRNSAVGLQQGRAAPATPRPHPNPLPAGEGARPPRAASLSQGQRAVFFPAPPVFRPWGGLHKDARRGRGLRWRAGLLLGVVLAIVAAGACSSPSGDGGTATSGAASPAPATRAPAPVSRTGPEIFATTCAVCHGANGEGQPNWRIAKEDGTLPPPPLNGDGHTWHHADGLLYRIVSRGGAIPGYKSGMPAFGDQLSREEIVDVLTYVKSLWGDKSFQEHSIRETQGLLSENDPFPPKGG